MKSFLGRGYDNVPGQSFGYAWNREREEIRQHLYRRPHLLKEHELEFRVTKIQDRIHKYKPTLRQRQEAAAIIKSSLKPIPNPGFTIEELQHLVDLFEGANDPLSAKIASKALAAIGLTNG